MKTSVEAGLYLRLSRDDMVKNNDESMSISNQRDLLIQYVNERGWNAKRIYVDDGYTGTNFDRPDFKIMLEDIKKGAINMVITKDLSRLGRNYALTGYYTDSFFPDNNIRYIAVNDNIDTSTENDITPFKHVLNEMYAKDISRKVRSSKKTLANQGKFINSRPPYGYLKSTEDRHKLVIDEYVSDIVKRIFEMFLSGKTGRFIADELNKKGVPTPNVHFYSSINKPNPFLNSKNKWGSGTIINILKNPVYCGTMAQGKRTVKSYKNKQVIVNPTDSWIVIENTHEPIVSKEVWEEAQILILKGKNKQIRRNSQGEISIFAGIVKCADCGKNMTYDKRVYKSYTKEYYRCGGYINSGKHACNPHAIRQEALVTAVLMEIKKHAKLANEDEEKLIQKILENNAKAKVTSIARYEMIIKEKEFRQQEIDALMQSLFEEKIKGNVPENIFKRMATKYDEENSTLTQELEQLSEELLECKTSEKDLSEWISKIKKYLSLETLTRTIVVELIDSMEVSDVYELDGEKQMDIKIKFKFQEKQVVETMVI